MANEYFHSVNRRQVWWTFVIIVIVAVFGFLSISPKVPGWMPLNSFFNGVNPHLGLDLQGGTHLVYQADLSNVAGAKIDAMQGVRDVIERRVNAFGVSEPLVQTVGSDRLIVDLAGIQDVNQAIKLIGETPLLEFKEQLEATSLVTSQETDQIIKFNLDAKAKAEDILRRVQKGEDFAALAKQYSEDPGSKDKGGDLGFVKKGTFVPEFEKAIFQDLKVGQVSPNLVESSFGFHIIQKLAEQGSGDNLEVNSRHILVAKKQPPAAPKTEWSNTALSGKYLESARVDFDPKTGSPVVGIKFNAEGKDLFAAITKANVGKPVAIFLDGQLISQPTVQEEITQGEAIISGRFGVAEAKTLAQRLNAGALPVPISLISQQTIGPTLGKIYLEKSLVAGLIGFLAVGLFMIIFYRLMGIIAVLALAVYAIISLFIFQIWPITLTLSGIVGFILSLGMAVDANVLIFERTKEELRAGKALTVSLEEGFKRAWLSIRDSNASSLITCVFLMLFSSSIIKGFAVTLAVGIIVSLFSSITVTRTLLRLLVNHKFEKFLWLFGVRIAPKTSKEVTKN